MPHSPQALVWSNLDHLGCQMLSYLPAKGASPSQDLNDHLVSALQTFVMQLVAMGYAEAASELSSPMDLEYPEASWC